MASSAEIIEMYWVSCWNERRTDLLADVFADPYLHGRTSLTPADHAEIVHETVASFPDLRVELVDLADLGDTVITRTRFHGTHGGRIFGLEPTGRTFSAPSLDVYFFEGDRVARLWHQFDHLPILTALGAEVRVDGQVATFD
ncbi:MAG TPA: ester cyclase [Candidatus Limnocylindria bacterium]|nr:ester cyclase [Candidatus Limnocylindria bacterium]